MGKSIAYQPGKGVARVPRIMQMENLECGAVCLKMVLAYYGKWVSSEEIRTAAGVSRNGSRAGRMVLAARGYGMDADGFRIDSVAKLREKATSPCIIFLNYNHFVVLKGFFGKKAYINDPAWGSYTLTMDELESIYGGICIFLQPGESFEKSGKRQSVLSLFLGETKDKKSIVLFFVLLSLAIALAQFLLPMFDIIFFDKVEGNHSKNWEILFYSSIVLLYTVRFICTGLKTVYNLKVQGNLAIAGSMNYMWHVMHLPVEFFDQRSIGDILRRRDFHEKMSFTLVNTISPLTFDTILMFLYLAIMFKYSPYLGLVGIISIVVNAVISAILIYRRMNSARVIEREDGLFSSMTVSGIDMMETIKSCGAENGFFDRWAGALSRVINKKTEDEAMNAMVSTLPEFISTFCKICIMGGGIYLMMKGEITIGVLIACLGYFGYLSEPAKKIVSAGDTLSGLGVEMERVEDVLNYERDDFADTSDLEENKDHAKLRGELELKHITFGYSAYEDPVIRDFSLHVMPGEMVGFVGTSGCGKSTLSKLIMGLYKPWEGEILFDGKTRESIEGAVLTDSVSMVDQSLSFFDDSVGNNIKMWDPTIENFAFVLASLDASLHNEIMQRPGGYDYKITGGGSNFSGGQKQRIEIASALAHEPSIMILDEATSAMDAAVEKNVINAIRERGNTCIMIAHRLSTIRNCDKIVMIEDGSVIETGTYDELIAKKGAFYALVNEEDREAS